MDLFGIKASKEAAYFRGRFYELHGNYLLALGLIQDLKHQLDTLKNPPPAMASPMPRYITEQEEDIMWQRDHGHLDTALAEDILRELEFESAEIQFDDTSTLV